MRSRFFVLSLVLSGAFMASTPVSAQLRVTQWNVTNYTSGRISDFQTAIYSEFQGRSMRPDIFVGQEFVSQTAVNNFLSILNTAPGSPGDWVAAPFFDGTDTDNAMFYRSSKVRFLGMSVIYAPVATSDPSYTSDQPRATVRYDVQPIGYTGVTSKMAIYSSHMKSGSASTDIARRLKETTRIRTDAGNLPAGWNFMICSDTNTQSSSQSAYQQLVGTLSGAAGRFYDPINRPGSWENNATYQNIHTQEPSTQMDSRHDQILISGTLWDGSGLEYIGNPAIAFKNYSSGDPQPWNDPNHSFRCWGNDGNSYNAPIRTTANTQVGPTIAQALINSVLGNGHLPVYLDLKVPAKITTSTLSLDFGFVDQGQIVSKTIGVTNSADVNLWTTAGISPLKYSFTGTTGVTVPSGTQSAAANTTNQHTITLNTNTPGLLSGSITVTSDDPDNPTVTIPWVAVVVQRYSGDGPKHPRH